MNESKWNLKKIIMFVLLVLSVIFLCFIPSIFLFILIGGFVGAISWYISGRLTPLLYFMSVKLKIIGDKTYLIRNELGRPKSLKDKLGLALDNSLFPTLILFFFISYSIRLYGYEEGMDLFDNPYILSILIIGPVLTLFVIPVKILLDSMLRKVDKENRTIVPAGWVIDIRLLSIGGIAVVIILISTLVGALGGDIEETLIHLIVLFVWIYPMIFVTSFIYYSKWHHNLVDKFNKRLLSKNIPKLKVKYFIVRDNQNL